MTDLYSQTLLDAMVSLDQWERIALDWVALDAYCRLEDIILTWYPVGSRLGPPRNRKPRALHIVTGSSRAAAYVRPQKFRNGPAEDTRYVRALCNQELSFSKCSTSTSSPGIYCRACFEGFIDG